jgi:hypothetical protein
MDVDIIMKMGFFISDLHCHIKNLHATQFASSSQSQVFTVYRGQGLSKTDFDQMMKMKGELMSFNSFISTSTDRDVSAAFTESILSNIDLVAILFVMAVDPSISSTSFTSINAISSFKTEDQILFSMHTVFRICEIKSMDDNNRL